MTNNALKILTNITETIMPEKSVSKMIINIQNIFASSFNSNKLNIYIFDQESSTMRDCSNNWSIIDDTFDKDKIQFIYKAFEEIKQHDFIINEKAYKLPANISDINIKLTSLFMPVFKIDDIMGLIEIEFENETLISLQNLALFKLIAAQISLKLQNIVLHEQSKINVEFHDSMKNIAKIIETQYELSYIIPIIGEMLDRFISDHLIYVFFKQDDKFNLVWPKACNDTRIFEALDKISIESDSFLTNNNKIGVFPLVTENNLSGCIVARSTLDSLSKRDITYLEQLTKQAATTINRANSYARILQYATLDALTNLNNRRQFETRLNQEIATTKRQSNPLCAMMIDIDFFKKVNDTYGHASGDDVLRTVASIIKEELRESDIPSRYGGEEFAVLLPYTHLEEAQSVGERLRKAVENKLIQLENNSLKVTISMGIAQFNANETGEQLFERADSALYMAKNNGRNQVIIV